MTRIIIAGARGKMGEALLKAAAKLPQVTVTGEIERRGDLGKIISHGDVVIDFTTHEATVPLARLCAQNRKPMVIGTTGHTEAEREELGQLAAQTPIVLSANFSTGVNTLFWLTAKAAEVLGPDFDLEIVEMHHRLKKDAPSGTAQTLARILAAARQQELERAARHGRQGLTGARASDEIGIHSVRGGDVVGDHTVIFAAPGERLELTHKASSRETFANGALRAALWVMGKSPRLYDMQDVLGFK